MQRPDFVDDSSGSCMESNISGGDNIGTPPDRNSIMASTSYCQNSPLLSNWDIVGVHNAYGMRADNVISNGSLLYARKRSNGDIYRRSGSGWVRIGSPGGQFVLVGSVLYGLSPDSNDVNRYSGSGTDWTRVGSAAREILRCGGSLCATNPDSGVLMRYSGSGTNWTQISPDGALMYASTSSKTYRLTVDRGAVEEYSGSGTIWTNIRGSASFLFATTTSLYATEPISGRLLRYDGSGTSWTVVGSRGRTWAGVGSTLFGLSPDRQGVWRYSGSGTSWTNVGSAADWIYGGASGSLYATNPTTKNINRFDGSTWVDIGQP